VEPTSCQCLVVWPPAAGDVAGNGLFPATGGVCGASCRWAAVSPVQRAEQLVVAGDRSERPDAVGVRSIAAGLDPDTGGKWDRGFGDLVQGWRMIPAVSRGVGAARLDCLNDLILGQVVVAVALGLQQRSIGGCV